MRNSLRMIEKRDCSWTFWHDPATPHQNNRYVANPASTTGLYNDLGAIQQSICNGKKVINAKNFSVYQSR